MLEKNFDAIKIGLASPEQIRAFSKGEVKKPETINYRTLKPERDGLFCERIFGPTKDWECHCGKYKRIRYKGLVCDRCGVEITRSKVRRERMGHIELAAPVSHIWYFKGIPSRMGLILNMSPRSLEKVLYFAAYVVLDPGKTGLQKKDILSETDYKETLEKYGSNNFRAGMGAEAIKELLAEIDLDVMSAELHDEMEKSQGQKKARIIKQLEVVEAFRLSGNRPEWMILDVVPVIPPEIRPMVQLDGGRFATSDLNDLYRRVINRNNRLKRLLELGAPDIIVRNEKRMLQESVDALIDNGRRGKPVTGPGNRPLKSLSDMLKGKQGRFRQNLLGKRVDYSGRSVIVVGPELKIYQCGLPKEMALELFKPFVMKKLVNDSVAHNIKNAKKKVERADDSVWDILDEIIKDHPVMLNRAPTLHRLGIQAFEPVLVEGRAIRLHPLVCTAYNADFDGDQMAVHVPLSPEAQAEARFLMLSANNLLKPQDGKPVTVPTQDMVLGSFYLTVAKGETELSGAQKPTKSPVAEFKTNKEAMAAYSEGQIGLYDAISIKKDVTNIARLNMKKFALAEDAVAAFEKGEIKEYEPIIVENGEGIEGVKEDDKVITTYKHITMKAFADVEEALLAYDNKVVTIHEPIKVRVTREVDGEEKSKVIKATIGRLIFNQGIPQDLGIVDRTNPETMFDLEVTYKTTKKELEKIIDRCIQKHGITETAVVLDQIKAQGFKYSTKGAITVGVSDMEIPPTKPQYIKEAEGKIDEITSLYKMGFLTDDERYSHVIEIWKVAIDNITKALMNNMGEFNPISMMATSGARGNVGQIRQLAGIRGLMADTTGKSVEIPVKSSFREGLDVLEFFISSHGARKGLADTALRTADSGYLTRRLVDVSQDVIVREDDCGTLTGVKISALENEKHKGASGDSSRYIIEPLSERITGRYLAWKTLDGKDNNIVHPQTGELILSAGEFITKAKAKEIENAGITEIEVRSVISCNSKIGVCSHCYGANLATGEPVNMGEAVGVIAAQSIGEPGTQLTMRTFHSGGIAGDDITQGLPRIEELFEARKPKGQAIIAEHDGIVQIEQTDKNPIIWIKNKTADGEAYEEKHEIPYDATIKVSDGDFVKAGDGLTIGSIAPIELLRVTDAATVQRYLSQEVQKVYKLQGVDINDKHIEVIIRQMMRKVKIEEPGDSGLLQGTTVERREYEEICDKLRAEGKKLPEIKDVLLGITKASLATDSFLSAASFQETTRVLTDAAIKGKVDPLIGLKENVIIGKLIPAGTGMTSYNKIELKEIEEEIAE